MLQDIPISFIFYKKEEKTKRVFHEIRRARPKKIYLISDGPKDGDHLADKAIHDLREWVESNIDWDANVVKLYADKNLGCKERIITGLNCVFDKEEWSIIIEDDCLPCNNFFPFISEMLVKYKDASQVMMVAGSNWLPHTLYYPKDEYFFSKITPIWGWGTWKRAWKLYDPEMKFWPEVRKSRVYIDPWWKSNYIKQIRYAFDLSYKNKIDAWDYQWKYSIWINNGLSIIPRDNMVVNIGYGTEDASHTTGEMPEYLKLVFEKTVSKNNITENFRNIEIPYIMRDEAYDLKYDSVVGRGGWITPKERIRVCKRIWKHRIEKLKNIMEKNGGYKC